MARPSSSRGKSPQPPRNRGKSPQPPPIDEPIAAAPSPAALAPPAGTPALKKKKSKSKLNAVSSYKSDGVDDNDVFLLPVSDYWVMLALTVLSTIVRVFRIYQPSSVVFDEVQ